MTVSVKNKKIVSVTKKSLAKKKATVTIKAKKKGSTKVYVGTVASIAAKAELFK